MTYVSRETPQIILHKGEKIMARAKMVTRTITATKVEAQIVTISASEITTINVTVSGEYDDTEKLLKAVKKATETADIKVLQVLTSEKVEKLYGMLETDFLAQAKELDPETRKALAQDDSTDATPEADAQDEQKDEEPTTAEPEAKKTGKRGSKA